MHSEPGLLIIPAAPPSLGPQGPRASIQSQDCLSSQPRPWPGTAWAARQWQLHAREGSRACFQSQVCLSSQLRPLAWNRRGRPPRAASCPRGGARMHTEPGLRIIPAAPADLGPQDRAHAFRARFAYHPSRGPLPGTAWVARQVQRHAHEGSRACIQRQDCSSSQPRQSQVCLSSQPRPHPLSPEVAHMHSERGLLIIPTASPGLGPRGPRACIQSQVCLSSQPRPLAWDRRRPPRILAWGTAWYRPPPARPGADASPRGAARMHSEPGLLIIPAASAPGLQIIPAAPASPVA